MLEQHREPDRGVSSQCVAIVRRHQQEVGEPERHDHAVAGEERGRTGGTSRLPSEEQRDRERHEQQLFHPGEPGDSEGQPSDRGSRGRAAPPLREGEQTTPQERLGQDLGHEEPRVEPLREVGRDEQHGEARGRDSPRIACEQPDRPQRDPGEHRPDEADGRLSADRMGDADPDRKEMRKAWMNGGGVERREDEAARHARPATEDVAIEQHDALTGGELAEQGIIYRQCAVSREMDASRPIEARVRPHDAGVESRQVEHRDHCRDRHRGGHCGWRKRDGRAASPSDGHHRAHHGEAHQHDAEAAEREAAGVGHDESEPRGEAEARQNLGERRETPDAARRRRAARAPDESEARQVRQERDGEHAHRHQPLPRERLTPPRPRPS